MRKRIVRAFIFLLLIISFSLFALTPDQQRGERLFQKASLDMIKGDWSEGERNFKEASTLLMGERGQLCLIRSLQIRYELGQYDSLPGDSVFLVTEGINWQIKREALKIEILSLIRLGWDDQALILLKQYKDIPSDDPSWLMVVREAYLLMNMIDEASRVDWLIRRDYSQSPEALILTGEAARSIKPNLLLP